MGELETLIGKLTSRKQEIHAERLPSGEISLNVNMDGIGILDTICGLIEQLPIDNVEILEMLYEQLGGEDE